MNIHTEIMKMNSYLKKFNKGLVIKNGLIKGITNDLGGYPYKPKRRRKRKNAKARK